jgi:hypothetical protein
MTVTPKILGQEKPTALVSVTLFTVPANSTAEFSIFINNQGVVYDGYTISLVPNGQEVSTSTQLAYNTQIGGQSSTAFSAMYLNSGDSVIVSSSLGTCSFLATGILFSQ